MPSRIKCVVRCSVPFISESILIIKIKSAEKIKSYGWHFIFFGVTISFSVLRPTKT